MKIRIWGARGSIPSPIKSEAIEEKIFRAILNLPEINTKDPEAVRAYIRELPPLLRGTAGGNTTCVEVQSGGETIIIDAGSGLRELGIHLMKGACGRGQGRLHIVFSHCHWDHIQGFPFFLPALVAGNEIIIYGIHDVHKTLIHQQQPINFPLHFSQMRANMRFIPMEVGVPFAIGKVSINTIENAHPGKAYSFRFEDQHSVFVHASDAEYQHLDDASVLPYIEFFKNADALVFDAQYTLREAWQKVDWGHSSAMIGVDLARAAGVKKLLLFHHDPTYSDDELQKIQETAVAYQAQDTNRPTCDVLVAYEGMTLDLTPAGAADVQFISDGGVAVLTPFDGRGGVELLQALANLTPESIPSTRIIDLSQIETLTTAGLKALVALRQEWKDTPVILVTASESVRQVVKLAGYLDYFSVYASLEAAMTAVQARETLNLPGQIIKNRYLIQNKLGEDRITAVLKATDLQNERTVALKILSSSFSPETLKRFVHQTQYLTNLDHPNIAKVYAWETDQNYAFLVEEYVEGETLHEFLLKRHEPLAIDRALVVAMEITQALEYAHSRGVIHTDLKPQNIYLTPGGVKVNGFGLGRLIEGHNLMEAPLLFLEAPYLAPEQILGQVLDARTDLYALGVIFYQLLTGKLPFDGDELAVKLAHVHELPRPPREWNAAISLSLEHVLLKLLAKNPNGRYANAQQARRIANSLVIGSEDVTRATKAPLVQREAQFRELQKCWLQAREGKGQLAFITGETGIGKTTLAQQVASQSPTAVLLISHCQELGRTQSYHLFAEILRAYFATVPPEFSSEAARGLLSSFASLVPEIHDMIPNLPTQPLLNPEQERLRLMTNLTQFIRQASQERPWLLILDDLQWADQSSLDLLRYLGHHLPTMSIFIIGIYRDIEVERGHPLLETLRDLGGHPTYVQIILDRLNLEGVGELLNSLWQANVPLSLVEKVYQHTEGNPFYVEEVANGLVDDGLVLFENGAWHFPTLEAVRIPPSIQELVWRRVANLSPNTQTLLRQAAVLGQSFRFDDLQVISGLSEWEVLEHLDMALERQLVQELPNENMLRFRHAEIRHVLYSDLGILRRRILHRAVAEWYETLYQQAQNRRPSTHETEKPLPLNAMLSSLVYHYHQAEDWQQECHYARLAGEQAARQFANSEAINYLTRALELVARSDWEARYDILMLLERVYALRGMRERQRQVLDELQIIANHPGTDVYHQVQVALRQAGYAEINGDYLKAITQAQMAIRLTRENHLMDLEIEAYLRWGMCSASQGDYDLALTQLRQALALAQEAHLPLMRAQSLRSLGEVTWKSGDPRTARKYSLAALQMYQDLGDRQGEGATLSDLAIVAWYSGSYDEANERFGQALRIYREIGDRQGESKVLNNLGVACDEQGDYELSRTYLEQGLRISREIGEKHGESLRLSNLSELFHHLEDHKTAYEYGRRSLLLAQEMGNGRSQGYALNNIGHSLAGMGNLSGAATAYQQSLDLRRELKETHLIYDPLAGLARVAFAQKDTQLAQTYVEEILQNLDQTPIENTEEPVRIFLSCYDVLREIKDPRTFSVLERAYRFLQNRAEQITRPETRHMYLENVKAHRRLMELWQKYELV